MSLGSHFVSMSHFPVVSSTRQRKNTNALHLWVPEYTLSQRGYIGETSPLRMHVQMRPIQRNARCVLPCAWDLVLAAYLPDICIVSCWSHDLGYNVHEPGIPFCQHVSLSWCIVHLAPKERKCTAFVDTRVHLVSKRLHWCNQPFENARPNTPDTKECTLRAPMCAGSRSGSVSS